MASTTRETENVKNAGDQPAAEKPEKKAKATKEKKKPAAKNASHRPYFQMIKEALLALNEKGGSSPHAIAKYMEEKHKAVLPENFRKMLALQLKNSASKGKLTKVKASYKLCEKAGNKKPTDATKKPKKTTPKRSGTVKKAKKMTPAKAKQPKSIKSPAVVKKARKASA